MQELAEQLDDHYSAEEINYLLSIKTTMASLDMPLQSDRERDFALNDLIAGVEEADAFFQQEDLKAEIQRALERCVNNTPFFTKREADILRWYF
ncbi:MAG: hypothetical protein LBG52_06660 [Candidatus Peribacteria bacterium]|nr:hypothetical protein [Candidatus Peribacteria bacterium]